MLGCAAVALGAVVAGCSGSAEPTAGKGEATGGEGKGGIKLLYITNSNADWWNAVEKGMQDGGKESGVSVEMRRNEGKTQGQIDRLQEALGMKDIQGVAVSVIEADAPGV